MLNQRRKLNPRRKRQARHLLPQGKNMQWSQKRLVLRSGKQCPQMSRPRWRGLPAKSIGHLQQYREIRNLELFLHESRKHKPLWKNCGTKWMVFKISLYLMTSSQRCAFDLQYQNCLTLPGHPHTSWEHIYPQDHLIRIMWMYLDVQECLLFNLLTNAIHKGQRMIMKPEELHTEFWWSEGYAVHWCGFIFPIFLCIQSSSWWLANYRVRSLFEGFSPALIQ